MVSFGVTFQLSCTQNEGSFQRGLSSGAATVTEELLTAPSM